MKITLLSAILLFSLSLHSRGQQTFRWGVKAGGTGTDIINDISSTGNDIYLTGRFSGKFVSGNEEALGEGMTDFYLVRLNGEGKTGWVRSLTGKGANSGSCITPHKDGIYAGGTVSGSICSGKDRYEGEGTGVFVSSWNKRGKINWLTRLPYTGHATLDVLETAPDGTLLAGGLFQGTLQAGEKELKSPGTKKAYWIRLTKEGWPLESGISSGGGNHRLVSAAFDKESNLYQLFSVSGDFTIDRDTMLLFPRTMKTGLVVTKINKSGNREWIKSLEGTGYNEGVKILTGNNNELVICANFNKTLKLQDTVLNTTVQLETALLAWDMSGEMQWVKTISSPVKARAMDVLYTRHGNIMVSGYFRSSYAVNEEQFFTDVTGGNIFLLQLDSGGELVWHDEPGREASGFSKAFTLDETGNIIFAGGFRGELKIRDEQLKSSGKEDVLVAKYFNCLQKEIEILGDCSLCRGGETELNVSGDFNTYLWNGGEWGENRLTVNQPGTYVVTAFDRQGCAASDTVEVVALENGSLGLPEEVELYPGNKIVLSAEGGYSLYRWENGTQSAQREISYAAEMDSMMLHLAAETYKGCTVTDSVKVRFNHTAENLGVAGTIVKAWPNPVREYLSWHINTQRPENVTVTLTDSKSVLVSTEEITGYVPGSVQNIDMSHLAGGNYLLTVKINDVVHNRKIVKK